MKFYSLLLLFLIAGAQSKSILPEGFQIEGLEGIDLNSLLSDEDEARQLSAITDRLKTLFQGTINYLQSLRKIPKNLVQILRRPLSGNAAGASNAASSLVDNMVTSGSEVVPSVVDTSGNSIGNFFRRAMRAAWGKRQLAEGSSTASHQKEVLKGLARIAKTFTNSKMILGQLHRLAGRNAGMKRVYNEQPVLLAGAPVGPLLAQPVAPAYPANNNGIYQY